MWACAGWLSEKEVAEVVERRTSMKGVTGNFPIETLIISINRKRGKTIILQPLAISTTTFESQR